MATGNNNKGVSLDVDSETLKCPSALHCASRTNCGGGTLDFKLMRAGGVLKLHVATNTNLKSHTGKNSYSEL